MKRASLRDVAGTSSTVTIGVTDLMTSLAVIFILLFTAYVSRSYEPPKQVRGTVEEIQEVLREHFKGLPGAVEGRFFRDKTVVQWNVWGDQR